MPAFFGDSAIHPNRNGGQLRRSCPSRRTIGLLSHFFESDLHFPFLYIVYFQTVTPARPLNIAGRTARLAPGTVKCRDAAGAVDRTRTAQGGRTATTNSTSASRIPSSDTLLPGLCAAPAPHPGHAGIRAGEPGRKAGRMRTRNPKTGSTVMPAPISARRFARCPAAGASECGAIFDNSKIGRTKVRVVVAQDGRTFFISAVRR